MFAEISSATGGIRQPIKKALLGMYALVVPGTILVIVFAPSLLRMFNGSYVEATHVLRLMAVFAILGIPNYVGGSIVAFYKKVAFLTFANAANAAVVVVYCYLFATDLNGILAGWIWGEVVNLACYVGGAIYYMRRDKVKLSWAR
jgi:O-antigen/teichoic acid export membrane protein